MSKKVKKKDIQDKIDKLTEELDGMEVTDDRYDKTVEAIARLMEMRDKSKESKARAGKDSSSKIGSLVSAVTGFGTLALATVMGSLAYKIDQSDELVKNKNSLGFFNKIFRI